MAVMARVVVQTGIEVYEHRELPVPEPGPVEAVLEMEACGVCGTDLEVFTGKDRPNLPLVPGHEPVGRILRLGRDAGRHWGVGEGQRVAVFSRLTCGTCLPCRSGSGFCSSPQFADGAGYGYRSPEREPGLWGGFATHLFLPAEAVIMPIADRATLAAASLHNALTNGFDWVCEVARARPGQTMLVLGPGPRGLACALAGRVAGLGPITVTGLPRDVERLELARHLGADAAVTVAPDMSAQDLVAAVGYEPDIVIDTTPLSVDATRIATEAAARGGTVVLAGVKGADAHITFLADHVQRRQIRILGAATKTLLSMRMALRIIEEGEWPLDRLASHAYPLIDAREAVLSLGQSPSPHHVRIEP